MGNVFGEQVRVNHFMQQCYQAQLLRKPDFLIDADETHFKRSRAACACCLASPYQGFGAREIHFLRFGEETFEVELVVSAVPPPELAIGHRECTLQMPGQPSAHLCSWWYLFPLSLHTAPQKHLERQCFTSFPVWG